MMSKTTCTVILAVFVSAISFAQQGINYKALIKDNTGNVVANQSIDVQFTILKGVAQTNVYQEAQSPTTDVNGMMIVNIGEGTTSNNFSAIDWGSDDHYLNVQIDTGSGLTDMGTTQFMAVPYALNALSSSDNYWLKNGDNISTLNDKVGIGVDPQAKLDILGGEWNLDAGNPGDLRIGNPTHNFRIGIATGGGGAGITRMYTNSNALILGSNNAPTLILEPNGSITAPSLTNTLINDAGDKALVTKEYVDVNSSSNTSSAKFYTSTHITGYSNATNYALILNTTEYNFGGGTYNNTTGEYTVPYTGVYNISTTLKMNFVSSVNKEMVMVLKIYVNGFQEEIKSIQDGSTFLSGYPQDFNYTSHLNLNANDVISFKVFPVWGSSTPAPFINQYSNISITKVY